MEALQREEQRQARAQRLELKRHSDSLVQPRTEEIRYRVFHKFKQGIIVDVRAFTLLELLIVIAIIGIVMAISLTALSGARRAANSVQCQAQLRSFGQAINGYINDHNTIPETDQGYVDVSQDRRDLVKLLDPYWDVRWPSIEEKVYPWCCPSDTRKEWLSTKGATYFYYPSVIYITYCTPPNTRKLNSMVLDKPGTPILLDAVKLHGGYWNALTADGAVNTSQASISFTY